MRIGIILTGDYSWAGGVYYSLNIIQLLHTLPPSKNTQVVAIVNSATPKEVLDALPKTGIELAYLDRKPFVYRLYHKLLGDRFPADINGLKLHVLYPLIAYHTNHKKLTCKTFYWLYDFQHKFLPHLFTKKEIEARDHTFELIARNAKDVVFSSYDSENHFDQFYPESKSIKHVYNFVSLLKKPVNVASSTGVLKDYFIVCNQFWPHKNHLIVLKALAELNQQGRKTHIVFTGKYTDDRNAEYVNELSGFIKEHELDKAVTLTGFISREEQINLIVNARAVIQPSFFEGWSTVVEDAKALNKFLLASNIAVNREQVKRNVLFFDPNNHLELVGCIQQFIDGQTPLTPIDYASNIETSKNDLIKLFKI